MKEITEQLRCALPPVFLGAASDDLTGGAICWGTIQNKRSRGEVPDECFVRLGPRVLVVRDRFLDWWGGQLQPAVTTKARYRPVPRAGQRRPKQPQPELAAGPGKACPTDPVRPNSPTPPGPPSDQGLDSRIRARESSRQNRKILTRGDDDSESPGIADAVVAATPRTSGEAL